MAGKLFVVPSDILSGVGTSKASSGNEVQVKANGPNRWSDCFDRIPSLHLSMFYLDTSISFAFEDKYHYCGGVRFFCEYSAHVLCTYLGCYALKLCFKRIFANVGACVSFFFHCIYFYALPKIIPQLGYIF